MYETESNSEALLPNDSLESSSGINNNMTGNRTSYGSVDPIVQVAVSENLTKPLLVDTRFTLYYESDRHHGFSGTLNLYEDRLELIVSPDSTRKSGKLVHAFATSCITGAFLNHRQSLHNGITVISHPHPMKGGCLGSPEPLVSERVREVVHFVFETGGMVSESSNSILELWTALINFVSYSESALRTFVSQAHEEKPASLPLSSQYGNTSLGVILRALNESPSSASASASASASGQGPSSPSSSIRSRSGTSNGSDRKLSSSSFGGNSITSDTIRFHVHGSLGVLYGLSSLPLPLRPLKSGPARRRLRVYLFPTSGRGRAQMLWSKLADPLLQDAGCQCDVVVTQHAGHCQTELSSMPWSQLSAYNGVLCAGGDGALAEVLNGIMHRKNWAQALRVLTIGVLPTGSGNGLACSLLHGAGLAYSVCNAAFLIAKGARTKLDIASTFILHNESRSETNSGLNGAIQQSVGATADRLHFGGTEWGSRRFSFLSTEWGLVADLDIESEKLRALGDARFDVYGLIRGIFLRKYHGRLSFLPVEAQHRSGRKWSLDSAGLNTSLNPAARLGSGRAVLNDFEATVGHSATSRDGLNDEEVESDDFPPEVKILPSFSHPTPLTWKTIEGTFTFLWITNTSHQSVGLSVSPQSSMDDGHMIITLIRDTNPFSMIHALLSLDSGDLRKMKHVEVYRCSAFRLEPDMAEYRKKKRGCICIDGELVPYGPIQAEVHPGLVQVYGLNSDIRTRHSELD